VATTAQASISVEAPSNSALTLCIIVATSTAVLSTLKVSRSTLSGAPKMSAHRLADH